MAVTHMSKYGKQFCYLSQCGMAGKKAVALVNIGNDIYPMCEGHVSVYGVPKGNGIVIALEAVPDPEGSLWG